VKCCGRQNPTWDNAPLSTWRKTVIKQLNCWFVQLFGTFLALPRATFGGHKSHDDPSVTGRR
jgi:hypothetical protein